MSLGLWCGVGYMVRVRKRLRVWVGNRDAGKGLGFRLGLGGRLGLGLRLGLGVVQGFVTRRSTADTA